MNHGIDMPRLKGKLRILISGGTKEKPLLSLSAWETGVLGLCTIVN